MGFIRISESWFFFLRILLSCVREFEKKVVIKYSLFDLSYIKVYTTTGKFLCKAERITLTHPVAFYEKENLDSIDEYDDENYLDLLEATFNPYITMNAYNIEHEEEIRSNGIQKVNDKAETITSQMSFKHLL